MCQFRPLDPIMRSRSKIRPDMGTPAIGKKSLFRKVLPSRIRFSEELWGDDWSWSVEARDRHFMTARTAGSSGPARRYLVGPSILAGLEK
jgi:hypothetical protein